MTAPTAVTIPRPRTPRLATRVPFAFVHINKCAGSSVEIALGIEKTHLSASRMRDMIGSEEWEQRFTFSIVRHPADRVVSIYHFRAVLGMLGETPPGIDEWVEGVWHRRDPDLFDHALLLGPGAEWLCDDDGLMVDFVARFETLERDWRLIASRLGVDCGLKQYNANPHPGWEEALSPGSKAIIAKAFADDLELFGYQM